MTRLTIGITGQAGVGKSYASNLLKTHYDFFVIDLDKIGHNCLMEPEIIERLVNGFGKSIVEDGLVNRGVLGAIVFSSKDKLNVLNSIVHPVLYKKVIDSIALNKETSNIVIEGALLQELNLVEVCNNVIVIHSSDEIVMQSGLDLNKINMIRNNQKSKEEYQKMTDLVLENTYDDVFRLDLFRVIDDLFAKC